MWRALSCIFIVCVVACTTPDDVVSFKTKTTGTSDIIYDLDITPDGRLTAVGGYVWTRGICVSGTATSDIMQVDSISNKGLFSLLRDSQGRLLTTGADGYLFTGSPGDPRWQFHRLSHWDILHNIISTENGYLTSGGKSYGRGYTYLLNRDLVIDTALYFDFEISDVKRVSDRRYIAAGWGNVMLSDDNGHTWKILPYDGDFFASIHFMDSTTGWIIGYNGTMLQTTDGGQTWHKPDIKIGGNGTNSFRKITGTDTRELIITGNLGRLWRSDDAGKTWQQYKLPTDEDIYDAVIHNGKYYVSGTGGLIAEIEL